MQSKELSEIPDAVNSTRFNTTVQINVYKTENDFNDNKQFCEIAYLSDEENGEYDIIHNPEKFILYVDGEKVE